MKRIYITALILVALLPLLSFHPVGEWINFTSKEGKFSVLLPAQPKSQKDSGGVKGTVSEYKTTIHFAAEKGVTYMIVYADFFSFESTDNKENLRVYRDNFNGGAMVKLTYSKDVEFAGQAAHYFVSGSESEDMYWTSYIFIKGNRLYHIAVGSKKEVIKSDNQQKFFNSFKLNN